MKLHKTMNPLLNAEIIKAAAVSPLGILSLMCLIVAVVALAFFRKATERTRLLVFAVLIAGAAGFAWAVLRGAPVVTTTTTAPPSTNAAPTVPKAAAGDCLAQHFATLPGVRVISVEEGSESVILVAADEGKDAPVALRFTQDGKPLGALVFAFFTAGEVFKLAELRDAQCAPVQDYRNVSRGGSKGTLQNWDSVGFTLNGAQYEVRFGYNGGEVSLGNFRRVSGGS